MTTRRHAARNSPSRKTHTTLGELIAAAYDVSGGAGLQRAEHAARLLTAPTLARRCSRQLRFVR